MENSPIQDLFRRQAEHQALLRLSSAEQRIAKLRKLLAAVEARAADIRQAAHLDYRKAGAEVDLTEIYSTVAEIRFAIGHLRKWMRPLKVANPAGLLGTHSEIHHQPKGVALIIGPWNYPFSLIVIPLVSAIAAGCCAVLKPSELTPHMSALLGKMVAELFDPAEVAVVEGDAQATQQLLALPFDHIFFTGSTRVGKLVMTAAAQHLASVTLELGGKSPVIVDRSAHLEQAAERIAWAKFINAGQTCVAPDYVLVHEDCVDGLVAGLRAAIARFYGASPAQQAASPDLCRIINARNFERLDALLAASLQQGAQVAIGGQTDAAQRYIAPTVLTRVTPQSALMGEEIFGPILPVLTYQSLEEVYAFLRARDKPLALYIYAQDRAVADQIIAHTSAGGTLVNNAIVHLANPNLPFGGIGPSGLGHYHGQFGFAAFSHQRAVMRQGRPNIFRMMYPPYSAKVTALIRRATRWFA